MGKFDMAQFLSDAGVNLDTGNRKHVEYIPIDKLVPDPDNFYELSAIDDLAENIALFGLQQPIVVRPMPGDDSRYIIVSGHRRHAAILKLIQEDGRDDLREVWCVIDRGEDNPKLNELKLIYANSSTRVLSSAEQAKQAEKVEKLLYELKEEGMEFPGRMRDHVAAACNVSTGKLARLKVIRDGLADSFRESYESSLLYESTAYELARMSVADQDIIFAQYQGSKNTLCAGTVSNIAKQMEKAKESIPTSSVCVSLGYACPELINRRNQAAKLKSWESLTCKKDTCCLDCFYLQHCEHPCSEAKDKQKEVRKAAKDAEKESARRVAERRQLAVDAITESWRRMCSLAKEKEIDAKSVFTACRGCWYSSDSDDMAKSAEGKKKYDFNDCMPGNLSYDTAKKLIATADLLGCSIDYLLGRDDAPTPAAAPTAEPEKCVQFDTWHTGNPPAPGDYIAYGLWDGDEACDMATWDDDGWDMDTVCLDSVSAWAYPPDKAVPASDVPAAEPEKCVKVDTWNTGNPPKLGWYICRIEVDCVDAPQYERHWYGGKTWQGLEDIETVTHWVPVVGEDEYGCH